MKHLFTYLFLLAGLLIYTDGRSQTNIIVTLESGIETALKQNPEYKIAGKELSKADASVGEAYSVILPQLTASANLQHNWDIQQSTIPNFIKTMLGPSAPPGMPDFVQIAFGLENTFSYGAMINQPLFLGGAGVAGIQAARAARKMTAENLKATRQNLIFQTVEAFYSCLLSTELVKVQEEAYHQAQTNLEIVNKKFNVGAASGFDKMRAEVEMANLQPALIAAKNQYQSALTRLQTILGYNQDVEIEVSGELTFQPDELENTGLSELQKLALQNRPEVALLDAQKTVAQKNITIARSEFLPKIFFSTDYSFLAMRNDLNFGSDDFSKGFTSAISLQFPLFSGFRSARQYQKARLDYKITTESVRQAENQISAEVELVFNSLKEAREKLMSANETVSLAQEALRLANLMYEEGANTQLDVVNSRLALTQAQMNYFRSLYEYQVARYQLHRALGQLNGAL